MDYRLSNLPTESTVNSSMYMTPSPDASFDSDFNQCTPPLLMRVSVEQDRISLSKLLCSNKISLPKLVYPTNNEFVKEVGGVSKTQRNSSIPSIKLTPRRSSMRKGSKIYLWHTPFRDSTFSSFRRCHRWYEDQIHSNLLQTPYAAVYVNIYYWWKRRTTPEPILLLPFKASSEDSILPKMCWMWWWEIPLVLSSQDAKILYCTFYM